MDITDELKTQIKLKNITKSELSKRLGISRQVIYKKLKFGNWKHLEVIEIKRILDYLQYK